MKIKKVIIAILIVVLLIFAFVGLNIYSTYKQKQFLNSYIALINEHKYEELYDMISENSQNQISKEDFVARNKNIYNGIDAVNVSINITGKEKQKGKTKIIFDEVMPVSAGTINFSNSATIVKEKGKYKIEWSSNLIFPELENNYKVRVSTIESKRGEILDRNGEKLAENGKASRIGLVPGKMENKQEAISQISKLTEVSEDFINQQLSAPYVKDDTFVPIKKVSMDETELKDSLLQIPGVKIEEINARVYPSGESLAHIIGYTGSINEDELEQRAGKGYSSESIIGKTGLEYTCEDTLRGIDGKEIYIEDEQGNKVKQLAIQEQKDGTDIKTTIDKNIQEKVYNLMKDDKGLFVIMNPTTGELLAAVSTPSYDNNDFSLGISNDEWTKLTEDKNKPLTNKLELTYCPGSTFKPLTAAIGLSTGKLLTQTEFNYSGLKWQKDSSWGNDYITTLTQYSGTKNIKNALIHSDNIFFGQAAMQIGSKDFCEELYKIGFNEQIDFSLNLKKSQYSNSGTIENEKKLADSGYGQGDILVNPIHMASIYSAFANDGNMVKPYIVYDDENKEKTYLKENVFSSEVANEIKNDLIQVVENPEGTANDMKMSGHIIAGKTGTAELKKSADDNESGTLGWFDCFSIDENSSENMLIISMVENIQDNVSGGSHYLIQKIRTLF